jgi:leader peptidase (prepilin peptidase)/N-methyltransferase
LVVVFALLGLFVGSFLNVCIDRLPRKQSVVNPPSHCDACNHKLGVLDMVPVFSYLVLRGRCRYCKAHVPVKLPVVEGVTGLLFALLYLKFDLGLELAISLVYVCLLTVIFVIDLERQLVLNKIVLPGIVLAFIFSFFWPHIGTLGSLTVGSAKLGPMFSALAGGGIGLAAMSLPFLISRGGMGMGDIKLAALIGLMTGFPLVLESLLLSVIIGGVIAAVLLLSGIKKRKDPIPFAPFMATAGLITLLWGPAIYHWYLG